jgi:hypothetical protein
MFSFASWNLHENQRNQNNQIKFFTGSTVMITVENALIMKFHLARTALLNVRWPSRRQKGCHEAPGKQVLSAKEWHDAMYRWCKRVRKNHKNELNFMAKGGMRVLNAHLRRRKQCRWTPVKRRASLGFLCVALAIKKLREVGGKVPAERWGVWNQQK